MVVKLINDYGDEVLKIFELNGWGAGRNERIGGLVHSRITSAKGPLACLNGQQRIFMDLIG